MLSQVLELLSVMKNMFPDMTWDIKAGGILCDEKTACAKNCFQRNAKGLTYCRNPIRT